MFDAKWYKPPCMNMLETTVKSSPGQSLSRRRGTKPYQAASQNTPRLSFNQPQTYTPRLRTISRYVTIGTERVGLSSLIGKNMRTRGAARGTAGSAVASFTIATPTPKYELPRAQVTLASWPGKHRPRSQASMPWLVSWPRTWDRDCTKVATHYSRPFDEY